MLRRHHQRLEQGHRLGEGLPVKETRMTTRTLKLAALAALTVALAGGLHATLTAAPAKAEATLPVCATSGDKDGDGVADADDSTQTDSCTLTSTGFENCLTGEGDGIPDCDDGTQ
jgi:hypothetical protein